MAVDVAVGAFNIGTGAAGTTVAVGGLGFQPKAIIFWWSGRTETTNAGGSATLLAGMGFATATSFVSVATRDLDAAATSNVDNCRRNDACILECADGAIAGYADVQSMDAGGFTLEILDQFVTSLRVSYTAYGGSDITNVEIGDTAMSTSTGSQTFNNVGNFQPDITFFMPHENPVNSFGTPAKMSFGVAAGSGANDQFCWSGRQGPLGTGQTNYYCFAGECMAVVQADDSIGSRCLFTSHNASPGGFTLNVLESGIAQEFFWMSIKGGSWKVGNVTTQTDTTTAITVNGLSFAPKSVLFVSAGAAANTQDIAGAHMVWSMGAATSASNRTAQEASSRDGNTTMFTQTFLRTDAVYIRVDPATDAITGLMDIQSFDATGFTCIMDDADPTAALVGYVAAGDAASASFSANRHVFVNQAVNRAYTY